jgi:hypothetical protein
MGGALHTVKPHDAGNRPLLNLSPWSHVDLQDNDLSVRPVEPSLHPLRG